MKKKILAIVMSLVLLVSFMIPAYALDLGGLFGGSSSEDSEDSGSLDINDILASDAMQEIMSSEGVIDITNVVMDLVLSFGSLDIQAMGQEKALQLIQNLIDMVGGFLVDTKTNVEVFASDPVAILDNLLGLDVGSLTTQPDDSDDEEDEDELVFELGDVDGDGRVTASDARLILRRAAKLITFTAEQDWLADVDDDGKVTALDARIVLRVAAQLETLD